MNLDTFRQNVGECVHLCLCGYRSAVKYVSPTQVIKATRQRPPDRRSKHDTVLLTTGAPNYYERRFIRACRQSGEPFPVRRVQLREYPPSDS